VQTVRGPAKPRIPSAADSLKVSTRTIQRLIARYKSSAQTTSLVPHQAGPRKLYRRLGAVRERRGTLLKARSTRFKVKGRELSLWVTSFMSRRFSSRIQASQSLRCPTRYQISFIIFSQEMCFRPVDCA
jgi:hypothetical protein